MADVPRFSFVARSGAFGAFGLASTAWKRYELSKQREDLDTTILHFTESILLRPRSWLEIHPTILSAFLALAGALVKRSKLYEMPEDAIYAAKYLRHLRDQPRAFAFPRHQITTSLMDALASQVKLKAGDAMQNIGEMAVLCRELLALDMSDVDITPSIALFADAVLHSFTLHSPDQPLDQVIRCLREARKHKPDLRDARLALAWSLNCRYILTAANDDYEEAVSVFDETIASTSPGDGHDKFVATVQDFMVLLAYTRSIIHPTPEHLEEAIYHARALPGSSLGLEAKLEALEKQRFNYFGSIEGQASSGDLQILQRLVHVSNDKIPNSFMRLNELRDGIRSGDITGIDGAIEEGRSLLASTTPEPFRTNNFHLFCDILSGAFKRTKKIEFLDDSIGTLRHLLENSSHGRFWILTALSKALFTRFRSFPNHRTTQDVVEALELISQSVNDAHASSPNRFQSACLWATFARLTRHPSVSVAYESALSLMQDALHFAPTLQLQHATLATYDDSYMVPLEYASYQVEQGHLEGAIQTLERGRALLWSEMRNLHTSIDQLLHADPDLGHKFDAVNRDLEELTKSVPPSHQISIDDSAVDGVRAADPFGRLLLKQRGLLKGRDKLISQIQALPGFDSFLTSPSFDTPRSAASSGPVIIINHSRWRSDILVLLHDTPPSLITTSDDFYSRAHALKDKLLDSRDKYGLDSSDYEQTLTSVLAELHELVGRPVIDRLRHLKVPEQSRIWWCPTSVFCSLPLHAMGPIPSDDGEMRYFLDLYICSYTPTLSALIHARNRDSSSRSLNRPSLLLVAQPDPSLPTVGGEIQAVRALDTEVTSLVSEAATPAAVIDGFSHHQFVHFACHGTLEAGKPFEAGFELYGGKRLTLLEIVRSHLPTAEFAFLSACHTAEVTEGSIADEGLHLAAAVQYCGFRSVVGTMWAMVDEDGQDLAKHFYKALFSNSRREQGIPYYERSAKALRFAVKKLRGKRRMTLERWVNFVHYGA